MIEVLHQMLIVTMKCKQTIATLQTAALPRLREASVALHRGHAFGKQNHTGLSGAIKIDEAVDPFKAGNFSLVAAFPAIFFLGTGHDQLHHRPEEV